MYLSEPLIMMITESPDCFSVTQRWSSEGSKMKSSQPQGFSLCNFFPNLLFSSTFFQSSIIISLNQTLSTSILQICTLSNLHPHSPDSQTFPHKIIYKKHWVCVRRQRIHVPISKSFCITACPI